ncbi:hypothetical protein GQ457_18G024980 [Hibiscus cannabinus]
MTNVSGGEANVTGHVCTCAGHGNNEGQAQVQLATAGTGHNQWYVDSGATHHVTPKATKIVQGTEYAGPGKITVDDGANLNIAKIEKSVLPVLSTTRKTLVLSDLMHVPQITKNLISVSKLARDNHVFLEFHAYKCVVRDEDTGAILLEERESEGIYKFDSIADHSVSKLQQHSPQGSSNELLIVPGIDKVRQLFASNEWVVQLESEQGGASMSGSVPQEMAIEHDPSNLDVEHAGSQQSLGDIDLGRTTSALDGLGQAGEMAAEVTDGDEIPGGETEHILSNLDIGDEENQQIHGDANLEDSADPGRTTSALSDHEHSVGENEGDCVNEEFGETRVAEECMGSVGRSTEAGLEAESTDEDNTSVQTACVNLG